MLQSLADSRLHQKKSWLLNMSYTTQDTPPTEGLLKTTKKFTGTISGGTRHYQSFSKAGTEPVAWPCLCRESGGSPSHELVCPCMENHTRGLQPWAPPLWGGEKVWWRGWNPGEERKAGTPGCFGGGIAELGWALSAGLVWSPPTADSPEPRRSFYQLSPWITRRIPPPFSPPADVLWLGFRKIATPILDTVERSSSGTRSKEGICHALIKTNFPCTQSHIDCRVRNCPVWFDTGRLCCHCAPRVMVTSPTLIYLYIL